MQPPRPGTRRVLVSRVIAILWLGTMMAGSACGTPRAAPGPPKLGDRRYYAFGAAEARLRALEAHDADGAAAAHLDEAQVVDLRTGTTMAEGRASIRRELEDFLLACPTRSSIWSSVPTRSVVGS